MLCTSVECYVAVRLRKPAIAAMGRGERRKKILREISPTAKLIQTDDKKKMGQDKASAFVFHRRPRKPIAMCENTNIVCNRTTVNHLSRPLSGDVSNITDSRPSNSGPSETPGSDRGLFITQIVEDKTPLRKPHQRPSSAHAMGEKKQMLFGMGCFNSSVSKTVETKKRRPASAHVSGAVRKGDMEPTVYGLADNRRVSGSGTDLSSAGRLCLYKLSGDQGKSHAKRKDNLHQDNT